MKGSEFGNHKYERIREAEKPTSKGLSHEMDFKNFDQNLKNLA